MCQIKTPSLSENLFEFNRRLASFVSQDKYEIYKRGGRLYGGVGAGQWPEDLIFLYLYLNMLKQI